MYILELPCVSENSVRVPHGRSHDKNANFVGELVRHVRC